MASKRKKKRGNEKSRQREEFSAFNDDHPFGLTKTEQDILSEERTSLSEERTLLSYVRTSLALIGLALLLLKFYGDAHDKANENPSLWVWISAILFVLAVLIVLEEVWRLKHLRRERELLIRSLVRQRERQN
ncbi:DUF202 domain-containing protein [Candidatus Woesearchaeota archaeon]|nr:MAG: DUF202 domain-containing protein [Candidatus Woesearchaeota archaeon]